MILRVIALTLCGAAVAFAGFLIGRSLREDSSTASFGAQPSALKLRPADVAVPGYAPSTDRPVLAATAETTAVEASGDEDAGPTSEIENSLFEEVPEKNEETKSEENLPPKSEPIQPEPDITVGQPDE